VFTGTAVFDLLLPSDSRSLKAKRSYVRPIVAALRRFELVAADSAHVNQVLDSCERLVYERPEVQVLSVRRRLHGEDD
jgi:uncharacterized protein YlxP (DUF503 family)